MLRIDKRVDVIIAGVQKAATTIVQPAAQVPRSTLRPE